MRKSSLKSLIYIITEIAHIVKLIFFHYLFYFNQNYKYQFL